MNVMRKPFELKINKLVDFLRKKAATYLRKTILRN